MFFSIFGDIGDYDPTDSTKEYEKKEKTKEREREKDRKKSKSSSSYFDKSTAGGDKEVGTNTPFVFKSTKLNVAAFSIFDFTADVFWFCSFFAGTV